MENRSYKKYEEVKLGDKTLSQRVVKVLEQLSSKPAASISTACGDPHQAKAVYRLLSNEKFQIDPVMYVAQEETKEIIEEGKNKIVFIAQDTTEVNYTGLKETEGLGTIGTNKKSRGILVHSSIAIGESGDVLGLVSQEQWTRPEEEYGKTTERKTRPFEEKESKKWVNAMLESEKAIPEGVVAIHICDREGDIYELFDTAEKENLFYLCRRVQNRRTINSEDTTKIAEVIKKTKPCGEIKINVPRDSHTNRKAREARLSIKYGQVNILRPEQRINPEGLAKQITANFVTAEEIDPPANGSAIIWHLITNIPVDSFEKAVSLVSWYTFRWKIEQFHYVLKSGCKIEELQLSTAEKLKKMILIYSIISIRIMLMTFYSRNHPDESCELFFSEDEWKIIYKVANKTKKAPDKAPTVEQILKMIAKMGGYLGRKTDPPPGLEVIWRGLTAFTTIVSAAKYLT